VSSVSLAVDTDSKEEVKEKKINEKRWELLHMQH
jgi:hypothetical protein